MSAAQLERAFVPTFSREGERVKAGLGLFICYQIAEKHEGRIELQSAPGRGTTVTVGIPLGLSRPGLGGKDEHERSVAAMK